ncbi:MAG: hypothetical protein FWE16_00305 [Firmicutes bacterium]|nr:hypothetical protein [Bacillota bacterium]
MEIIIPKDFDERIQTGEHQKIFTGNSDRGGEYEFFQMTSGGKPCPTNPAVCTYKHWGYPNVSDNTFFVYANIKKRDSASDLQSAPIYDSPSHFALDFITSKESKLNPSSTVAVNGLKQFIGGLFKKSLTLDEIDTEQIITPLMGVMSFENFSQKWQDNGEKAGLGYLEKEKRLRQLAKKFHFDMEQQTITQEQATSNYNYILHLRNELGLD